MLRSERVCGWRDKKNGSILIYSNEWVSERASEKNCRLCCRDAKNKSGITCVIFIMQFTLVIIVIIFARCCCQLPFHINISQVNMRDAASAAALLYYLCYVSEKEKALSLFLIIRPPSPSPSSYCLTEATNFHFN